MEFIVYLMVQAIIGAFKFVGFVVEGMARLTIAAVESLTKEV